jgi:hypothetical protein
VEKAVAVAGLRSTIVLLVLLVGIGGYIYFVESKRDPAAADAKPKAFTELTADSIEEIRIKNADGETSHLQKVGDNWQLLAPQKATADTGVVGTVTSNLSTLEVQRVVDENPSDLKQYGLEPARIDLSFRLKDQKDFQQLYVGEKTPTGGDVFAKRPNEKRVFLISSYLESIFNKSSFDLRDKAVLKFDRAAADRIEIVEGASTLEFTRTGMDWRISKPMSARADQAALEGVLTRLSSTFMQKIVEPEAVNPAKYGLDRPALRASVMGGGQTATLAIGRVAEGARFAKDSARPEVFTVEETLFTELSKDAPDYRRKDLFDGRSFTANRVEIQRAADKMAFDKSGTGEGEMWKNATGQTVDLMKVEDLLSKLTNIRAVTFDNTVPSSLKMPNLTVTIRFDTSKTETVTFGGSGADIVAARADEPGSAKIDSMPYEEAIKAIDALK